MKQKFLVSLTLALILAMLMTSVALADYVVNNIDNTIDGAFETRTITTGQITTVGYYIQPNNSDPNDVNGCNATGSNPVTVNLSVPGTVTASTTSLTFTGCGSVQNVNFASNTANTYTIAVASVSGGKTGSAWNTVEASFYLIVNALSDTTPPAITPSISGTLGNNGWYVSDVNVSWNVSDPDTTVTSMTGCEPGMVDSDTDGVTFSCSATSTGGTSSQSVTIKRDATPPTITGASYPEANAAGWNTTDVSVVFSCEDSLSGIATCGPNQILVNDGAGQSQSGTAVDKAGNSASTTVSGINIDKTAPSVSASAAPAANASGWNNSDVTVSFSGTDTTSGIASCSSSVLLNGEGAGQTASGSCTDVAGNSAGVTSDVINIDKTAPTMSAAINPDRPGTGWWNIASGAPTVSFTCQDALSGLDGTCPAPHIFEEGANQTYSQTVFDLAGNSASAGVSDVDVDLTGPVVTYSRTPAANSSGWNNTDVNVTFKGTDALSGLSSCLGADFTLEGANQSMTGTCYDEAGNPGNYVTVGNINIDKTAPAIALVGGPEAGGTYYFGFVPPTPTCSASDALSGLDGACSVSGYGDTLGSHTIVASVTDKAGNPASTSASYTVLAWTLNGFYKPVDMSGMITVWNTVKGGSTVPLKFEIFAGSMELVDTSYVAGFSATPVSCGLGLADAIEITATGGTSLRYDAVEGQFIYNWQTPKNSSGCYKVSMTTQDGSSLSAFFKLK